MARPSSRFAFIRLIFLSVTLLSGPAVLRAQFDLPMTPEQPGSNPADQKVSASPVNVYVTVREMNGLALDRSANVTLNCPLAGITLKGPTQNTSQVQFEHIPSGDCSIEVTSDGFKLAKERITVNESIITRNQYVFVYLHPVTETSAPNVRPVVTPNLLDLMDKSTQEIRKSKFADARKHLDKALAISPNNPDVLYLSGLLAMNQKNWADAAQQFQKAISVYPTHERSLLGLGEVQMKLNQPEQAAQTIENLLRQNAASWRANLIAAAAYAQLKNYSKAEQYADRSINLSGSNGAPAKLLLGQILAAQGNFQGARQAYQELLRDYPNDETAVQAKADLANFDQVGPSTASVSVSSQVLPSLSSASLKVWAPADIDAARPALSSDVACQEHEVIEQASLAAKRQFVDFERFVATEHIEHEEVTQNGEPEHLRSRDFNYMVFVEQDKKDKQLYLDEKRDGGTGLDSFPTSLATVGLIGLGVDIFQPGFAKALDFKCEGLGQWRGKPAWVMYFKQKQGERSFLRLWQTKIRTVEVPLKGRVWIATNSFDVLHIETDLREPMKELELARDHISIDYGPVQFKKSQTELWLPWNAEIFLDLHGKRYHHRHTLSNYAIFDVATDSKISAPKNVPQEDSDPNQKPQ